MVAACNADAAIYIFRSSREGEFLWKTLKGFNGVLASDFYSAYDGLHCVQQRCLIHLMPDMNRAMLDSLLDQELQSITTPFGAPGFARMVQYPRGLRGDLPGAARAHE